MNIIGANKQLAFRLVQSKLKRVANPILCLIIIINYKLTVMSIRKSKKIKSNQYSN